MLKLGSDTDLEQIFLEQDQEETKKRLPTVKTKETSDERNKHGMRLLKNTTKAAEPVPEDNEEDFETLLEQSFSENSVKTPPRPGTMPVHKRLKRYPPVEKEIDLHGQTAMKARMNARSFIVTHRQQGYFTLRIIVGKGRNSEFGPVLPDVVEDLAIELKQQGVILWFEWDKKQKRQSGSLIVYVKQFD